MIDHRAARLGQHEVHRDRDVLGPEHLFLVDHLALLVGRDVRVLEVRPGQARLHQTDLDALAFQGLLDRGGDAFAVLLLVVQDGNDAKTFGGALSWRAGDLALRGSWILGAERLNLVGITYGTRVAQQYQRRYPERVRSALSAAAEAAGLNDGWRPRLRMHDLVCSDGRHAAAVGRAGPA